MKFIYTILLFSISSFTVTFGQSKSQEILSFEQETGAKVSINRSTLAPGFIRWDHVNALNLSGTSAHNKVQTFLTSHPEVLGVQNISEELRESKNQEDNPKEYLDRPAQEVKCSHPEG